MLRSNETRSRSFQDEKFERSRGHEHAETRSCRFQNGEKIRGLKNSENMNHINKRSSESHAPVGTWKRLHEDLRRVWVLAVTSSRRFQNSGGLEEARLKKSQEQKSL